MIIGISGKIGSGKLIYALIDPRNDQVRYVGRTSNPEERFKNHCNPLHNTTSSKREWIDELIKIGTKPIMLGLEVVELDKASFWERFYTELFRSWGFKLLNNQETHFGNHTSFNKGHTPYNKGKNFSEETKLKISKSLTGKESKKKLKVSQFTLENVFIKEYNSLTEAAKEINGVAGKICLVCQNKKLTYKNYIWKYS